MKALPPTNEEERLCALLEYDILDTAPEPAFDDIARLAAQICGTPIAAVSLVDQDRQWFKARVGLDVTEMPRDIAFCAHAILQPELLHASDARLDPRFQDNPLVAGEPHIRFYAGAPLLSPDSCALGTLCVADTQPHDLSDEQRRALENLGRVVMRQMEMRRTAAALQESQRTLATLMGNLPGMVYRCRGDQGWPIEFASQGCRDLTGYVPEELATDGTFDKITDPTYRPAVLTEIRAALRERRRFCLTYPILTRTGERKWVWEQGSGVFSPDGALLHIEGFVTDVTERRQAEETLRARTELLETILATIPHQVFWKDRESVYRGCNANFARAAGLPGPDAIIGKKDTELPWDPGEAEAYREADLRVMTTGRAALEAEEWYHHSDGSTTVGLTSKMPLHDGSGQVVGVLAISQDITERKELEAARERMLTEALERADRDPLTGLLNHRAFHKRLEEEADRAQREGGSLAVAMLDLDNFKFFNDAYGHQAGDGVLRQVAASLARHCRTYDVLARFGGDEFALLLPGLSVADAEEWRARMLAEADAQPFVPPGHDTAIPVHLSAGVAVFPHDAATRLEVMEVADARLRLAKSGGNAVVAAAQQVRREAARTRKDFSVLDALVTAVDAKDRYTRRHSEDVLAYSLQIAEALGLDAQTRHTLGVAALLHDVGKIGIPDAILRKPGRLTDAEFEAMRQHPQMGAIMVGAVPGFEATLDAIQHHHERWDGGGYPFGLRGTEIPLPARLMAVADAFSAMTTDRPYRKGMPEERALAILRDGAGAQWDPDCVAAFLRTRQAPPTETGCVSGSRGS